MKTLSLTLAAAATLATLGSFASAANYIPVVPAIDSDALTYSVPLVRADGGGMLVLEDHNGNVWGSADLQAGANIDVTVDSKYSTTALSNLRSVIFT